MQKFDVGFKFFIKNNVTLGIYKIVERVDSITFKYELKFEGLDYWLQSETYTFTDEYLNKMLKRNIYIPYTKSVEILYGPKQV